MAVFQRGGGQWQAVLVCIFDFDFDPGNPLGIHLGQCRMVLGRCLMLDPCQMRLAEVFKGLADVRLRALLKLMEFHDNPPLTCRPRVADSNPSTLAWYLAIFG